MARVIAVLLVIAGTAALFGGAVGLRAALIASGVVAIAAGLLALDVDGR